jgi:hypothetical protein
MTEEERRIQGQRGGETWTKVFHALHPTEQRKIVTQLIAAHVRGRSRLAGRPDPVLLTVSYRRAADGTIEVVPGSERPLPPEYGGDGRGVEALSEDACPDPNHPNIRAAADRIKAQLAELNSPPAKPTWGGRRPGAGRPPLAKRVLR